MPRGQYTLSLGVFSLSYSFFFFRCLICLVVFRFLRWIPSFFWKTKPCPSTNFGDFAFGKLNLIKQKALVNLNVCLDWVVMVFDELLPLLFKILSCLNLIFINFDGIHIFSSHVETKAKPPTQPNTYPGFLPEVKISLKYIGWFNSTVISII